MNAGPGKILRAGQILGTGAIGRGGGAGRAIQVIRAGGIVPAGLVIGAGRVGRAGGTCLRHPTIVTGQPAALAVRRVMRSWRLA